MGLILFLGHDTFNTARLQSLSAQLSPELEKVKELNKFSRPVLRGEAISGNGADQYLTILDSDKKKQIKKIDSKEIEPLLTKNKNI